MTMPLGKRTKVESFLQDFLDQLPLGLRVRSAWSFDIIETSKDEFIIVDINQAGNHKGNWSGFLQNPFMLKKLVLKLQSEFGWTFPGAQGLLLKSNLGNLDKAKHKIKRMYRKHGVFIKPAK